MLSHVDKAENYFAQKYHCSQAVLVAFADELGLTEEQALKLGGCFGAGMCKGEVCGACVGALMVLGLKYGQCRIEDLESRRKTNKVTEHFLDEFSKVNGSYLCKELLGCDLATEAGRKHAREHGLFTEFCPKMVVSAVELIEKLMCE
ncbi:MAG: C_GCAxxG_C_C family protein [Lachnospiraceae bacterium]|nr:C_GCAxxG_C_C family protein [Lachnospiraceae bacterium]